MIIGLVLLGEKGAPDFQFVEFDSMTAKQIGMNEMERLEFNSSLPEINLIAHDFISQVNYQYKRGMSQVELEAYAEELWNTQGEPVLSAGAFSGAKKAAALFTKLMGR